jgi:transcription antitermination factor NusG
MPTFVFIDSRDIQEALYRARAFQVPPFSPLLINGVPATVGLQALHLIGEPSEDPPDAPDIEFTPGDRVEICQGPFEGRQGIVDTPISGYFRVLLEKSGLRVDVPSFLLRKVAI